MNCSTLNFEKKDYGEIFNFGRVLGFLVMYLVSVTILYFLFVLTKKFPLGWNYLYAMGVIFAITLIGRVIQRVLR